MVLPLHWPDVGVSQISRACLIRLVVKSTFGVETETKNWLNFTQLTCIRHHSEYVGSVSVETSNDFVLGNSFEKTMSSTSSLACIQGSIG